MFSSLPGKLIFKTLAGSFAYYLCCLQNPQAWTHRAPTTPEPPSREAQATETPAAMACGRSLTSHRLSPGMPSRTALKHSANSGSLNAQGQGATQAQMYVPIGTRHASALCAVDGHAHAVCTWRCSGHPWARGCGRTQALLQSSTPPPVPLKPHAAALCSEAGITSFLNLSRVSIWSINSGQAGPGPAETVCVHTRSSTPAPSRFTVDCPKGEAMGGCAACAASQCRLSE